MGGMRERGRGMREEDGGEGERGGRIRRIRAKIILGMLRRKSPRRRVAENEKNSYK